MVSVPETRVEACNHVGGRAPNPQSKRVCPRIPAVRRLSPRAQLSIVVLTLFCAITVPARATGDQACCEAPSGTCFDDDFGVGSTCDAPFTGLGSGTTCVSDCECPALNDCTACMSKTSGNLASFEFKLIGGSGVFDGSNTTFTYQICQNSGAALSHFVIGLDSTCCLNIVGTSGPSGSSTTGACGADPTTSHFGLKFETATPPPCIGMCGTSGDLYSFTLFGDVPTAACLKFANKADAAEDTSTGCILGPNCEDLCAGVDCDDGDACTDDSCDPATGACVHTPNFNCDDSDACTDDACDPATGACVHTPNFNCDDSDACTDDSCDPATGTCVHTLNFNCDDSDACTDDSCDPATGACVHTPNIVCDDGDACTDDSCDPATGACVHTPNFNCDDSDSCTDDACDPATGACVHTPNFNCDDSDACTDDSCDPATGTCVHTPNIVCDDSDACTDDSCDPATGACVHTPNFNCDDSDACTDDACDPATGACVHTPNFNCDDSDACTDDSCDPATGTCVHTPNYSTATQCCNPATGSTCTINDGNACTDDACDPATGTCVHTPNFNCDDSDACTDDACDPATGTCVHTPNFNCDDSDACTDDSCDPATGTCVHTPNYSTATQCCNPATGSTCTINDGNACTDDACDPATGTCAHVPSFVCGDGTCNSLCEDCTTCLVDCNTCGDGCCSAGENSCSCPSDCAGACCGNDVVEGNEECDGTDDDACPGACKPSCQCVDEIPAVSHWGMLALSLLLLTGMTVKFGRERESAA